MIKPEVVNESLDDIRPYIEADGGYFSHSLMHQQIKV